MNITKAKKQDIKRIINALNRKQEKYDYITIKHVKDDFSNKNLYIIEENSKIVAIFTVLYDKNFKLFYIKRLLVLNNKNLSKGYGKTALKFAANLGLRPIATTPWKDNHKLISIITGLGFEFSKSIDENYMLYTLQ